MAEYNRTKEEILSHYLVEKEIASRLRNAKSFNERKKIFFTMYDELFEKVPHHPRKTRKITPEINRKKIKLQIGFIKNLLNQETVFLEIGSGDGKLAIEVSQIVKNVYAFDISDSLIHREIFPSNMKYLVFDGINFPIDEKSIDVAYSYQLMEHLHPNDAVNQLINIFKKLKMGGKYVCITPNKLSGPHDISKYFDQEAQGFHLKEYSAKEIVTLFKKAGFRKIYIYVPLKGHKIRVPFFIFNLFENIIMLLPFRFRKIVSRTALISQFLGINIIGIK